MPRANVPADATADAATLGAEGNERLTAWAGAALLIGLAAEGVTLLNVHWWLTAHMLIGIALLVPVAVKAGSTMYRFARYYTNSPAYVRKGPPRLLLRIIGPFLLLNTVFILLSGVVIPLAGSYRHSVEELHKLSFWTWAAFFAVHVLAYVWRLPRLLFADLAGRGTLRSAAFQRIAVVAVSGVGGMVLAVVLMPWVRDWISH
jgi:hypothetical protein